MAFIFFFFYLLSREVIADVEDESPPRFDIPRLFKFSIELFLVSVEPLFINSVISSSSFVVFVAS